MAYGLQTPRNLAEIITQMSYGDLLYVAEKFVDMNSDGQRDVATKYGMADTLFDWAESVMLQEAEAKSQHIKAA